ncbi:MAG TPA: class I SAM-dependent methyltransferase [Planctomycetota bacterium]|nr:class I SAM-dependent methyltransferase [Planctomycetota bacterium]
MCPPAPDSTTRFSNRVEAYVKYRPSYPRELLAGLAEDVGLRPSDTLADIGSGTGISSQLFLEHGNSVVGVEPNDAMRAAGDKFLAQYPAFCSLKGTAEATGLANRSVDGVVAGQAFHWFDPPQARAEFQRILKEEPAGRTGGAGGWIALIWNSRPPDGTPFLLAYEKLVAAFGTDYNAINHNATVTPAMLKGFFGTGSFAKREYANRQIFDFDGLLGRVRSSSYMPEEAHPKYPAMVTALHTLFDAQQRNGRVTFDYVTEVFAGRLG